MIPAEPVGPTNTIWRVMQGSAARSCVGVGPARLPGTHWVGVVAVVTVALISAGHDDTLAPPGDQHAVSQVTGAPGQPRQCGGHHQGGEQQAGGQAGLAGDALHREERLHEGGEQHDRVG